MDARSQVAISWYFVFPILLASNPPMISPSVIPDPMRVAIYPVYIESPVLEYSVEAIVGQTMAKA